MHSAFRERFDDAEALLSAAADALATYDYRTKGTGEAFSVRLPKRPPLPWYPPKQSLLKPGARWARHGEYEPVVTAVLDFALDNLATGTVYDIGSGPGYFTLISAMREDRPIEAHGFEMNPQTHGRATALGERLGLARAHFHLSGMSERDRGEREIWYSITKMFEEEPAPSAYRDPWPWRLKFWLQGKTGRDRLWQATVRVDSIDAFSARHGLSPGVIKIDVDGFEGKVLQGARETLASARPVILLELHKSRFLAPHGMTRRDVVRPLFDLGYACLWCSNHHRLAANVLRLVDRRDPVLTREETDFFLFA